jgi:hypothetical protein
VDRPRLPDRHKAGAQLEGDRRGEDEASRLDACDLVDVDVAKRRGDSSRRAPEETRVREQTDRVGVTVEVSEPLDELLVNP